MQFAKKFQSSMFWIGTGFLIIVCALWLQSYLFLHEDVSWLMHSAERMLKGGTYTNDFFDSDPPLIFYLYSIPIGLSQILGLSYPVSLRIFVVSITLITLLLCHCIRQQLGNRKHELIPNYIFIVLLILFLILPIAAFGQRDHLFLILIFPYLAAVSLRLSHQSLSVGLAFMVGMTAGIGFAIKPFFFLTFILIELYFLLCTRQWRALVRIETFTIILLTLIYVISIPIVYPEYIKVIIPHSYKFCFEAHFFKVQSDPFLTKVIIFMVGVLYLYFRNPIKTPLENVLLVAMISALGIFVIQGGPFLYYHIYPTLALALLLTTLFFCHIKKEISQIQYRFFYYSFIGLLAISLFGIPVLNLLKMTQYYVEERQDGVRQQVIQLMQHNKDYKTCYFISAFHMPYPMVDYAHLTPVSRYCNFVTFSILLRKIAETQDEVTKLAMIKESEWYFNSIRQELLTKMPDLILVDLNEPDGFAALKARLRSDPNLSDFWKNYRALPRLAYYQVYERRQ